MLPLPQRENTPQPDHRLCVQDLTKHYRGAPSPAVDGVSFCVAAGEILALVGPSGCGKTTTLRCLAGLERPEQGSIHHGELLCHDAKHHLPPEKRGIGLVFQDYALFPHLSVLQNVQFGLTRGPRQQRSAQAQAALERVGLQGLGPRRVQELSGGQQQRVAFARALAPGTDVLLLDEPFSNLDAELRGALRQTLKKLVRDSDLGVVLVTHDQEEAMSSADQIAVMRSGQLLQTGPPESVYRHPQSAFVARFLGRTNLLPGDAAGQIANTPLGMVELNREAHGPILLSLRPEHLAFDYSPDFNNAVLITGREFKGHDLTFRVALHERQLTVQTHAGALGRVGDRVRLRPLEAATVVEDDQ